MRDPIENVTRLQKQQMCIRDRHQDAAYPDFSSWKTGEDPSVLQKKIAEQSSQLKSVFAKQEKLALSLIHIQMCIRDRIQW